MTAAAPASARSRTHRIAFAVAIAIGVLALVVAAVAALTGIRLFAIQTPSMAETAPVGSLVVADPRAPYAVGDVITFTVDDRTVTHRIVAESDGAFTTRGDLNGSPDPWSLSSDEIVGRVVLIAPGFGFLLTAAPWLLMGAVVTEALTWVRRSTPSWSWSVRLTGWSLTTTLVSLWLRPWFDVRLLDYRPTDSGDGVVMHIVNTGVLPVLADGIRLISGQDAVITTTHQLSDGAFVLNPAPDPDGAVRLLLIALCLLPFVGALLVRPVDPEPSMTGFRPRPDRRAGRVALPVSILTVAAVVVLITVSTSTAAFSATLRNSTDTAGTNPFFTCRAAETAGGPWGAWALSVGTALTETDFSGSGRTGFWAAPRMTSTGIGCARDTPATSVVFDGSQCLYLPYAQNNPNVFSIEAWFQTTSVANGRIVGFGDTARSVDEGSWDRLVYLDTTGRVVFGIYPGVTVTVASPAGRNYADGQWHAVVATLSGDGMKLYVDGALVDSRTAYTSAQNFRGYWKIGCGQLDFWANGSAVGPTDYYGPDHFIGRVQYVAISPRALTAGEVRSHYSAGR